jgi:hypothetical protein
VKEILPAILAGILWAGILPGCSISSAEQDAIRQAWADRDAERGRECARVGGFLVAGSCLPRP